MNPADQPDTQTPIAAARRYSALPTVGKSLLATAIVALTIASFGALSSDGTFWAADGLGDQVSQEDAAARQAAFAAHSALDLSLVRDAEVPQAVANLGLDPAQQAALLSELAASVATPEAQPAVAQAQPSAPHAHPATQAQRLQLAWLTVWDTDAEDGDAVRIDSGGYSRTITLTKAPLTFAVPVPVDSVIRITGIRDGEGGGITVGLASGGSRAIFPIMSVGQTLGLNVKFK